MANLSITYAQILSTMVDGVTIITSNREVEKHVLAKTKDLLDRVGDHILGPLKI
jgi:Mrp family chromosome partitioning ATPase